MKKIWAVILSIVGALTVAGVAIWAALRLRNPGIEVAWHRKRKAEEGFLKEGFQAEEKLFLKWEEDQRDARENVVHNAGDGDINDAINALRSISGSKADPRPN